MNQLIRALVPSWKFFDGPAQAPELYYRTQQGDTWSDWLLGIPKVGRRTFKNLWINSAENFGFASHALLEYLQNDLQAGTDSQVSLALVNQLVRFRIRETKISVSKFQFKLVYSLTDSEALYTSAEIEIGKSS